MRIGQVSPLFERVPPRKYGGTELVVSLLTEELVRRGHDVTLFASGDSVTAARLASVCSGGLRLDTHRRNPTALHLLLLEEVARRARELDVVHFHTDLLHLPFLRRLGVPHVTTVHGRLDHRDLPGLYREYDPVPLVSISDAQRAPLPDGRFVATVHHGLPRDMFVPGDGQGRHLLFLGRFSPEKRCDRAIEIA